MNWGRLLVTVGIVLVLVGLLVQVAPRVPLLSKLGHLPGDIRIEKPGFTFYFPLMTSILVSIVLSLVLAVLRKK